MRYDFVPYVRFARERFQVSEDKDKSEKLLHIGEVAKEAGKSVRALHLYEDLDLLRPACRTKGGFRLYSRDAIDRVRWIVQLQAIGFTLSEIRGFVGDFEASRSGRSATARAREVFNEKLDAVRRQIDELRVVENDLVEAVSYLDVCDGCSPSFTPTECSDCGHLGHEPAEVPLLFAGLAGDEKPFDVSADDVGSRH